MSILREFDAFRKRLGEAIESSLQVDVLDAAKSELSASLGAFDFPYSRGPGGLSDMANVHGTIESFGNVNTLMVTDDAPFQRAASSTITLAEAVETGDPAYHMPEPRRFMSNAEEALDSGIAERAFAVGLHKRGF